MVLTAGVFSCNTPQAGDKKMLSVSIEPQKYFLETITGGKYQVNCVISSGVNPESFDPSPAQMVALSKSLLYFKVGGRGLKFEGEWIKKVTINSRSLSIVDCSEGVSMLDGSHAGSDPHVWSAPRTATVMARNMYDAVVKLDPENEDFYTRNLNTLLAEFAATDSIIKSYIAKAPSKAFFIYHPALSYFADEYGLRQYSIEYEGKNPTPMLLKQSIDTARQNNIKVVFIQLEFDRKNAETLADEIGAEIVPLNLLSYHWSEQLIKIAKALSVDNE
jgi:zinc transport system substrate-binding protein